MKKFITLILCLYGSIGFTQSFQIMNPDLTNLYQSEDETDIRPIQVDSVYTFDDYIIYKNVPFPYVSYCFEDDPLSVSRYGNSWIGSNIYIYPDGVNILEMDNLQIIFETFEQINSTWTAISYTNGDFVEAEIIEHVQQTILGNVEMVKTIKFTAYYENGSINENNVYHNKEVKIGENIGFIDLFPFFESDFVNYTLIESKIVGENLEHWPSYREIYDYEVGDEFHISESSYNPYNESLTKMIKIITSKEILDENKIKYGMTIHERTDYLLPGTFEAYTYDTEKIIDFTNKPEFLPWEPVNNEYDSENSMTYLTYFPENYSYGTNPPGIINHGYFYQANDNCYLYDGFEYQPIYYIKGCGRFSEPNMVFSGLSLRYCNKVNGFEWGDPFDLAFILDSDHDLRNLNILISPNPTQDLFSISHDLSLNNLQYCISDIRGNLIVQNTLILNGSYISTNNLTPGVYVILIKLDNKVIKTFKLIKK